MNPDPATWTLVGELFDQLVELTPAQRERALARLDPAPSVRNWLERLLAANDAPNDLILDHTLGDLVCRLTCGDADAELRQIPQNVVGRVFGHWRVRHELARGGMAMVALGDRADGEYHKDVAIKLLLPGLFSAYDRDRLHTELQLLARLEHANIARLIDGGISEDGLPYLVMEYVDGLTINDYCTQLKLTLRQRVQLFLQVVAAISYAHRQLVVHADIKASNVMVTREGQVKVVDFGIASVLGDRNPPTTPVLVHRCSPASAAPEQLRGARASTVQDVFGLGALLYELLCGKGIRDGHETATLLLGREAVGEIEPPSTRADSATAAHRLRGDLDAICRRALHTDPEARYPMASELAADLRRWLDQQPVVARNGGFFYRTGRLLRRHAMASTIALLGTVATLGAAVLAISEAHLARLAAARAEVQAKRTDAVRDFLQSVFDAADPRRNGGRDLPVSELLDSALVRSRVKLQDQPEERAALLDSLGHVFFNVGRFQDALEVESAAAALYRQFPGDRAELASARIAQAQAQIRLGDLDQAEAGLREALALYGQGDKLHTGIIDATAALGNLLAAHRNHPAEAVALLQPLLARAAEMLTLDNGADLLAGLHTAAAAAQLQLGDYQAAINAGLLATALYRKRHGNQDVRVAQALSYVAGGYFELGQSSRSADYDRQIWQIYQDTLGADHPDTMSALNELGTDDLDAGRPAQALQRFLTVLPAFRKSYGTESAYVTVVYNNIGEAQRQLGDPRSAVDSIKSALDIQSRIFGNEDPRTGLNQALYARALSEAGQLAPAREWFGRGLRTLRSGFGPKHPATARIEAEYGLFLIHTGAVTEAIDLLTKVEQTLLTSYPPASVYPTLARLYRGIGEARLGHRETARALLQTNLARLQASDHKQPLRVSEGQRVLETLDR